MKIFVNCGPPGCGKTRNILDRMLSVPGRYILSSPRTALLDEQTTYLVSCAKADGISLDVKTIHSEQSCRGSVLRRAREALQTTNNTCKATHIIVLITHETLMTLDSADLAGWHIRIDEVPDTIFVSGSMRVGASWSSLARHYALTPLSGTRWAQVTLLADLKPLHRKDYGDDAAESLAGFHKAATSANRNVFVDVGDWSEAAQGRRKIQWWSLWSYGSLASCASVEMTAARFLDSIAYHALRKFDDETVEVIERIVEHPAVSAQRRVRIHFYTTHQGSTAWWTTQEGSFCLVQISRHLERIGFAGFWAANDVAVPYFRHRFEGHECRPKLAGTNSLRHLTECAAFYSNKAQLADAASLEVLDLRQQDIQRARENEDLFQLVMRGAIRDPAFSGAYDVYVYSQDQAEALAQRLRASGVADEVSTIPVWEAGVMEVERPANKANKTRPIVPAATATQAQKLKADRERKRHSRQVIVERKKANGTHRKPGRPRKCVEHAETVTSDLIGCPGRLSCPSDAPVRLR